MACVEWQSLVNYVCVLVDDTRTCFSEAKHVIVGSCRVVGVYKWSVSKCEVIAMIFFIFMK